MKNNLTIPDTILIGYRERNDTYTGKLAYVIYRYKNNIPKETSWNNWRDKKIDPHDFPNLPTEGFVLNKNVGGYKSDWNFRQSYCRVYDPRGFEFEISIPNLLHILENVSSIRGKGLEGEFVYGWHGKDLILLSCQSQEYAESMKLKNLIANKEYVKNNELKSGYIYKFKDGNEYIFIGHLPHYSFSWENGPVTLPLSTYQGKKYYFVKNNRFDIAYSRFKLISSCSGRVIELAQEHPSSEYAELLEKLETKDYIYPHDPSLNVLTPKTSFSYGDGYFVDSEGYIRKYYYRKNFNISVYLLDDSKIDEVGSTQSFIKKYSPQSAILKNTRGHIIGEI